MKCTRCNEEQKEFVCIKCMGELGMRRCPSCLSCLYNEEKCDFCTNNNLVQKTDDYDDGVEYYDDDEDDDDNDWDDDDNDWDDDDEDWDDEEELD